MPGMTAPLWRLPATDFEWPVPTVLNGVKGRSQCSERVIIQFIVTNIERKNRLRMKINEHTKQSVQFTFLQNYAILN